MDNPISDEWMDVDNKWNKQRLPLQDQDAPKGLPFPHIEDSNGQYTIQYIDVYIFQVFFSGLGFQSDPLENSGLMNKDGLVNLCHIFSLKRSGNKPALSKHLCEFSSNRELWEG